MLLMCKRDFPQSRFAFSSLHIGYAPNHIHSLSIQPDVLRAIRQTDVCVATHLANTKLASDQVHALELLGQLPVHCNHLYKIVYLYIYILQTSGLKASADRFASCRRCAVYSCVGLRAHWTQESDTYILSGQFCGYQNRIVENYFAFSSLQVCA